jgi:hypothetical protein
VTGFLSAVPLNPKTSRFLESDDVVLVSGVILPVDGGLYASNWQPNSSPFSDRAEIRRQPGARLNAFPVGAITLPFGTVIFPGKVPVVRVIAVIQSQLPNCVGY